MPNLDGKGRRYVHPSGWALQHCGHPTANWPYFLEDPASHPGDYIVVSLAGLGFKTVRAAKLAIDGLVSGRFRLSRRIELSKGIRFRRVVNCDAMGGPA